MERAQPARESRAFELPVKIELSADALAMGDVLDAFVHCGGEATYKYRLEREGEILFEGEPVVHHAANYRPREAGRYRLEVIVCDEDGHTIGCEAFFNVRERETAALEQVIPYSQCR